MSSVRRLWPLLLSVVVVVVVEVTALPHLDSHDASSSQGPQDELSPVNIDAHTLLCLISASLNDTPSDCPSTPKATTVLPQNPTPVPVTEPPPPADDDLRTKPCKCAPHWQCRDKTTGTTIEDSHTSIVLDLRNNVGCGAAELVCCHDIDPQAKPPTKAPVPRSCGQRNRLGIENTFLGFQDQQTQFGEFPWTVVVTSTSSHENSKPLFLAGGSLVHPQLVLTTAHNIRNLTAEKLLIRLGDWNLATDTEPITYQEIEVAEVLVHPGYSDDPYHYYDLAALMLKQPAVLGTTVSTICLPVSEQDYLPDGCIVSGWGKKNFHSKRFERVMKAVGMPLVEHQTCQEALQGTRLGASFILHDSFLCAGGQREDQDACTGDGGSPLVCPLRRHPSRYVQVGVVAWGIECGRLGVPGVYSDVLKAGLWIDNVLLEKFGSSRIDEAVKDLIDIRAPLA